MPLTAKLAAATPDSSLGLHGLPNCIIVVTRTLVDLLLRKVRHERSVPHHHLHPATSHWHELALVWESASLRYHDKPRQPKWRVAFYRTAGDALVFKIEARYLTPSIGLLRHRREMSMRQFLKHGLVIDEGHTLFLPGPPESLVTRVIPSPQEMAEYLALPYGSNLPLLEQHKLFKQFPFGHRPEDCRNIEWLLTHQITDRVTAPVSPPFAGLIAGTRNEKFEQLNQLQKLEYELQYADAEYQKQSKGRSR